MGSCSATRRFRGATTIWRCDPQSCAHLESPFPYGIQQVHHASRLVRTPASRSLRAIRPADRGPAVRCGVRGGGATEGAGLADEAFQGGCPYGGDPRGRARLKSSTVNIIQQVHSASRVPVDPVPLAPFEPTGTIRQPAMRTAAGGRGATRRSAARGRACIRGWWQGTTPPFGCRVPAGHGTGQGVNLAYPSRSLWSADPGGYHRYHARHR